MQALNIPKATLVGNSLGGWIAADFARQHPDRVAKLVASRCRWMATHQNAPTPGQES